MGAIELIRNVVPVSHSCRDLFSGSTFKVYINILKKESVDFDICCSLKQKKLLLLFVTKPSGRYKKNTYTYMHIKIR